MSDITVVCVFVKGHVPFTPEYVTRLRSMTRRSLPAHNFVCLTDRASELPTDIETIRTSTPTGCYGWWAKVNLFNPKHQFSGRLLYLDLDVIVVRDLMSIVDYPARFALVPDGAPGFKPRDGKTCVKRFNSSVMSWDAGDQTELYSEWTRTVAGRLWGDQDWIGERCPDATAMPAEWFPRLSAVGRPPWPEQARVVLCKKPKNAVAVQQYDWFDKEWR